MLTHPTLDQLRALKLDGMVQAFIELAAQEGARTRSGKPCRSPATKKGRCRLHGGARGSGAPPGQRNGQYRHGERPRELSRSVEDSVHC